MVFPRPRLFSPRDRKVCWAAGQHRASAVQQEAAPRGDGVHRTDASLGGLCGTAGAGATLLMFDYPYLVIHMHTHTLTHVRPLHISYFPDHACV